MPPSLLSTAVRRSRLRRSHACAMRRVSRLLGGARGAVGAREAAALGALWPPREALDALVLRGAGEGAGERAGRVLRTLVAGGGGEADVEAEAAALAVLVGVCLGEGGEEERGKVALLAYAVGCRGGVGAEEEAVREVGEVCGKDGGVWWKGRASWDVFEGWVSTSGVVDVVMEAVEVLKRGLEAQVEEMEERGAGSRGGGGGGGEESGVLKYGAGFDREGDSRAGMEPAKRGVRPWKIRAGWGSRDPSRAKGFRRGFGEGENASESGESGECGESGESGECGDGCEGGESGEGNDGDTEYTIRDDSPSGKGELDPKRREEAQNFYAGLIANPPALDLDAVENSSPADHTSHPFEISFKELEFSQKVGEGAFAEVWSGTWLQSPVAIKKFRNRVLPSPDVLDPDVSDNCHGLAKSAELPKPGLNLLEAKISSDERLMRYASKILSDTDSGRFSRNATQSELKRFMSDDSREKYATFLNEVSLMNKLRHPHLLMYMGAVVHPRSPLCIVSELFEGGSLHDMLHSDNNFRPARVDAIHIALAVARGMNYLHSRSPPFLHRDLKPRNVLLSAAKSSPHVVICDFGLCKYFWDEDKSAAPSPRPHKTPAYGTASYMSPSVIDGNRYKCEDDVYSFGLLLWELCTGRVPYYGMRPIQIFFNVSMDGLRPEILEEDAFEPDLCKLIESCWSQDPSIRPSFSYVTRQLDILYKELQD